MSEPEPVQCYNLGCQQKFKVNENTEGSCIHHSGAPYFHDAMKIWSCCNKKSHDFTDFLVIKGCKAGKHNPTKPAPPSTAQKTADAPTPSSEDDGIIKAPRSVSEHIRPSEDAPLQNVEIKLMPSLSAQLAKLKVAEPDKSAPVPGAEATGVGEAFVKVGTMCTNRSCQQQYCGDLELEGRCTYHPGHPTFHEGMKFWSCCQQKTAEFDTFMSQEGCAIGNHCWTKQDTAEIDAPACRHDFHQTATAVTVAIYSKVLIPEKSTVKVNTFCLEVDLTFDGGKSTFAHSWPLFGPVVADATTARAGAKLEIVMKKAESYGWPRLEYVPAPGTEVEEEEDES